MTDCSTEGEASIKKTPLNLLHRELGAKMVEFAGYDMPLHYGAGILWEHQYTRSTVGLFDISHMGQIRLFGEQAGIELEQLVPSNIVGMANNRQRYTVLTNDQGGIRDDLMVSRTGDGWRLVVNAACKQQDFAYISEQLSTQCQATLLVDQALLALQGPAAASVLASLTTAGSVDISFMAVASIVIGEIECLIFRSGYTGEDGYEISVAAVQAEALARLLLAQNGVQPVGLGARDSLRLEAGLCLYGHDIDSTINPVEAGLDWIIDRAYLKPDVRKPRFPGATIILEAMRSGANRRRVGLQPQGRAPVREGAVIRNAEEINIGVITSGGYGPSIGRPVAMGYVASRYAEEGTELTAEVRGKSIPVQVVSLPFIPHRYHRA